MSEHTREPWVVTTDVMSYACAIRIKWEGGQKTIAYVEGPGLSAAGGDERRSLGLANARRIVACVNACASISTEDLEHATDSGRHRWVIVEVESGTTLTPGTFVVAKDGASHE